MTWYFREPRINPSVAGRLSNTISHHLDESDEAILQGLEELLFASVRQLAHATHLPATMDYRRLSEKLGLPRRHLCLVPHHLPADQKATRVQCSQSILAILRTPQARAWHHMTF
jgi:hypothetical protein